MAAHRVHTGAVIRTAMSERIWFWSSVVVLVLLSKTLAWAPLVRINDCT